MCSFVFAATYLESGAQFKTMETVEVENPLARATSARVTWVDLFLRVTTIASKRIELMRVLLILYPELKTKAASGATFGRPANRCATYYASSISRSLSGPAPARRMM